MKILIVAVTTLLSLSLGGGTYSPYVLDSASLFDITSQSQQSGEISQEVKAKIEKLGSASPVERAEAACQLGELRATSAISALIKLLGDDAEVQQPVCGEKHKWVMIRFPRQHQVKWRRSRYHALAALQLSH